MNKKLALLAAPVIMLAASATTAETIWGVTPVFGVDAQLRHMDFKGGLGENIFKHNSPQANAYVGLNFNDYFGIQAGYEVSSRRAKTVTLIPPFVSAGVNVTPGVNPFTGRPLVSSVEYTSISRIKGPHVDLVGYLPLSFCNPCRIALTGSVGLAHLRVAARRQVTAVNGGAPIGTNNPSFFRGHKTVLRLMGGIQHYICDTVGVRATVTWENTSRFRNLKFTSLNGVSQIIKPKNSINYGLGLFVTF